MLVMKYPAVDTRVIDVGENWQFFVKDNGIGIEQRHLSKIFDVLKRLHRKSQYAGTGIGLSNRTSHVIQTFYYLRIGKNML
ncbi:MAG: light-regulated signal transduction histidine kinase (bacteriophytochrome) [Kiritimatiellia bacterium]|jgi:light-regulated signal transduction histidine kinase (bacteriophytochrome)